jgi:hypothetical protein
LIGQLDEHYWHTLVKKSGKKQEYFILFIFSRKRQCVVLSFIIYIIITIIFVPVRYMFYIFYFCQQIKPFTVVTWKTLPADHRNFQDYTYKEFYTFPEDRDRLEVQVAGEEQYQAVTFSSAFCHCMLLEGLRLQTVQVPAGIGNVKAWSSSEADDGKSAEEERERIYQKWFPGVLLASQAQAKKKVRISVYIL